jgi:uncharacterized protein YycO
MTRATTTAAALLTFAVLFATGCHSSMLVKRPADQKLDDAYTTMWLEDLQDNARDGDIILRRGYAVLSDVITLVTSGANMSHAVIYDGETGTVIEAVDGGVKETALHDLVRGAHHVMIIRPTGLTRAERRAAVLRARSVIGTPFDYAGFIGLPSDDRFYCSELVVWAMTTSDEGAKFGRIITPGRLIDVGETVYDSGERGAQPLIAVGPYWRQ